MVGAVLTVGISTSHSARLPSPSPVCLLTFLFPFPLLLLATPVAHLAHPQNYQTNPTLSPFNLYPLISPGCTIHSQVLPSRPIPPHLQTLTFGVCSSFSLYISGTCLVLFAYLLLLDFFFPLSISFLFFQPSLFLPLCLIFSSSFFPLFRGR